MTKRVNVVNRFRDAWVEINLNNLEHNISVVKKAIKSQLQPNQKMPRLLATIKADGYGHGSVMCAPTLAACGIEEFGVATVDEGIELRQNKVTQPILVLGATPIWSFEGVLDNNIAISIFNEEHLEAANMLYERTGKKIDAHIKIDTGMNRIGIPHTDALEFIKKTQNTEGINLKGIFTHFADAESPKITNAQIENFKKIINSIDTENLTIHCQNSAAAFIDPTLKCDMIRLGIVLYGLTPLTLDKPSTIQIPELKQVIGLKGRITNIHSIEKDEGISYGHSHIAESDTKIVTIPIGYADGVSRNLSGKIYGSINGQKIKQVGRITMDQMMLDIGDIECSTGDIVTLLGTDGDNFFPIDEWARILGTINYELTCRLKVRLQRIYIRD